jgi:molecular chaperone IbpA
MRNLDFTPYRRSTVGFDRLFDMLQTGSSSDTSDSYPPMDIEKQGEDSYRVTLAVAGFKPDELEIVAQQNQLTVSGKKADDKGGQQFLHHGIATRNFERRFQLADFVEVQEAKLEDGLLRITLKREIPEAMKPHRISINGQSIEHGAISHDQDDERQAA